MNEKFENTTKLKKKNFQENRKNPKIEQSEIKQETIKNRKYSKKG